MLADRQNRPPPDEMSWNSAVGTPWAELIWVRFKTLESPIAPGGHDVWQGTSPQILERY